MPAPSIQLQALRKSYDKFVAVDDVSVDIPGGSVFGLLGPNGAGKTTTIRMIMNIIAPDTGRVLFFGRERTRKDLERVGYLPEERGLYAKMTVFDHLVFLGELHGMKRADAGPEIHHWLDRVGLADREKKKVEELSKGMQQKIQLVGTVLHDPEIVILDEPFSGLDPINQVLFRELLSDYKSRGKTVIFSTHIMEHAEKICDRICLISRGRIVLEGEMAEIKRRFGGNTYRLEADGDLERVSQVEGVDQVVEHNGALKLMLQPGVRGSDVLERLVSFLAVTAFHSEAPGLDEIFVKAVNDSAATQSSEP